MLYTSVLLSSPVVLTGAYKLFKRFTMRSWFSMTSSVHMDEICKTICILIHPYMVLGRNEYPLCLTWCGSWVTVAVDSFAFFCYKNCCLSTKKLVLFIWGIRVFKNFPRYFDLWLSLILFIVSLQFSAPSSYDKSLWRGVLTTVAGNSFILYSTSLCNRSLYSTLLCKVICFPDVWHAQIYSVLWSFHN